MDGTLISSTEGVVGAWHLFSARYPAANLDVMHVLNAAHGIRTQDNLRQHFPMIPEDQLQSEAVIFEQAIVDYSGSDGRKGINVLPGVAEIMKSLESAYKGPKPAWAICTSATKAYGIQALRISGINKPDVFITADDVKHGKPNPEPYLLGAKSCGVPPERCLVVEDAPAGVRSGKTAGCKVLALCTTHDRDHMKANSSQADYLIQDLSFAKMELVEIDGHIMVRVTVIESEE